MGHNHATKNIKLAFFLNLGFAILEFIGGILSMSYTLCMDAIHDAGDAFSLGAAFLFESKSQQDPSWDFHFGYRRFSVLSAFILGAVLLISSVLSLTWLFIYGLEVREINSELMIVFSIIGLCVNGFAAAKLHGGHSHNEKMISWHLIEDVLTWAFTLVGAIIIHFFKTTWLDTAMAVIVAIIVGFNALRGLLKILPVFLQKSPLTKDELARLREHIKNLQDVDDVETIKCWTIDGQSHIFNLRIKPKDNGLDFSGLKTLRDKVRKVILGSDVNEVFIEFI